MASSRGGLDRDSPSDYHGTRRLAIPSHPKASARNIVRPLTRVRRKAWIRRRDAEAQRYLLTVRQGHAAVIPGFLRIGVAPTYEYFAQRAPHARQRFVLSRRTLESRLIPA